MSQPYLLNQIVKATLHNQKDMKRFWKLNTSVGV